LTEGKNAINAIYAAANWKRKMLLKKKARFFVKTALWPVGA